jgi:hypothetical protein
VNNPEKVFFILNPFRDLCKMIERGGAGLG